MGRGLILQGQLLPQGQGGGGGGGGQVRGFDTTRNQLRNIFLQVRGARRLWHPHVRLPGILFLISKNFEPKFCLVFLLLA